MKKRLLDFLVCPHTKSNLMLVDAEMTASGDVVAGKLVSEQGLVYPIRRSIPRFVESDQYVDTFSLQRRLMMKRFGEWKRDETVRRQSFRDATGVDLDHLRGRKLFLDAGCGYGRLCHTIGDAGNEVIGVDMSATSIELAHDYLGSSNNVHLVQCDLTKMPFRQETFDYIFSIGVLHHTPDPEASFQSLVPYVKRGGAVAIWVYHPAAKRMDNRIRRITTKLPRTMLFCLCLAAPMVFRLYRSAKGIPQYDGGFWPEVMGWFDSWSPVYASVHEPNEVVSWFEKGGLREIQVQKRKTAVSGRRPD